MMRWVVDGALRFRLLVIALGVGVLVAGVQQARTMPVDALPEFAPPQIEVQTEALGLSAAGGREPGHPEPRGAPERDAVADLDPLHLGAGAVVDRAHLRAGHRRPARPPARAGAADAVVRDPERRQAADHHPAALDDEPGDDGRPLVDDDLADRDGRPRPLEHPAGAAGRPRRRQRRHLGPARAPAAGAGRAAEAARRRRHARPDRAHDGQRDVGVAADLPARPRRRAAAAGSTRPRSGSRCATSSRSRRAADLSKVGVDGAAPLQALGRRRTSSPTTSR